MKPISIQDALQRVADNPRPLDDDLLTMPVHELVSRTLFDIANRPSADDRTSFARANRARKLLLERLAGKREAGTQPVSDQKVEVEILDLTGGELGS